MVSRHIEEEDYLEPIRDIIATAFEPCEDPTGVNSSLVTTDQVKEKITEFSGFQIENLHIYNAMKEMNFRIVEAGGKFYWRVAKK